LLASVNIVMLLKRLYNLCVKRYCYIAERGIGWYRVTSRGRCITNVEYKLHGDRKWTVSAGLRL